ncbi:hypothetical protein D0Y65_006848 [Glycine soja]|uniref:No apical meristem-associated C-terminal domain-containing protein n=1 Tax=Glycine soja TaxID=3848 RepID=A0A445LAQ6_GLYSO|nr:hypothetical protein D0Y65_006848 [Glycine soja]
MNFMQNNQTPSTENSQSSESFPSMPQNNSSMFRNSPNSSSGPQTPSNDDVETQFPNSLLKLKTSHWNEEKDTHLIGLWHNVSTYLIVGDGQARDRFWMRVTTNYNNFRGELRKKVVNQLKSRWQKINLSVQKFKGHFNQVISLKKSSCLDNDVMLNTYVIWKEDEGSDFNQPKWLQQFTENCSKRMKNYASEAYSSSSNLETPIENVEVDTPSPIVHPIGQKEEQEKRNRNIYNPPDLIGVEEAIREINILNTKLVALREIELENEYYDILIKDTSTMSET